MRNPIVVNGHSTPASNSPAEVSDRTGLLTKESFIARLLWEERRTERSRRPFVLLLLEAPALLGCDGPKDACNRIATAFAMSIRETDVRGWYETAATLGVIFTEITADHDAAIGEKLSTKIQTLLAGKLTTEELAHIQFSYFVFPDDWDKEGRNGSTSAMLYPQPEPNKKSALTVKRFMDIVGSLCAIVVFSPVLIVLGIVVKVTSRGPILFRQKRVGQYGRTFTFLKFRSMYVANDPTAHQEYVKQLIAGSVDQTQPDGTRTVFKLTNDKRITPAGAFLRKTSLDELPQFFNVLLGDMSLVGPRPPVPYEVEHYDLWHRRRLLAVKPGITGLWQVTGRSRTTFDEMVRLDLQYAKSWSLALDIKILLRTPHAVLVGDGAY
jgi:lipopolysaccharide/colanic/teichoic acid biosynthesis glycosyltransferase